MATATLSGIMSGVVDDILADKIAQARQIDADRDAVNQRAYAISNALASSVAEENAARQNLFDTLTPEAFDALITATQRRLAIGVMNGPGFHSHINTAAPAAVNAREHPEASELAQDILDTLRTRLGKALADSQAADNRAAKSVGLEPSQSKATIALADMLQSIGRTSNTIGSVLAAAQKLNL